MSLMSHEEKTANIRAACGAHDLEALAKLATSSEGLLDDELRRIAWPILLGCSSEHVSIDVEAWRKLPAHRDEGQVQLDVDRAFVYYPSNESEKQMTARRNALSDLIISTLRQHPILNYFQGYHDIVQVLLLVLSPSAVPISSSPSISPTTTNHTAVRRLSLLRIRDFMLPSLSATTTHLDLIPAILRVANPELEKHLAVAGSMTRPFFALSATLTLYAHDVQKYGDIARLFDFLLAGEAVWSIYLFAVIVIAREAELLSLDPIEEPEMIHATLSRLPQPLDLESLISKTVSLYSSHPPETLPKHAWSRISSYSVLKTTHNKALLAEQTLEDGEHLFARQVWQMEWLKRWQDAKKRVWKAGRPAGAVGLAVLVAVVAYWLRREDLHFTATAWSHRILSILFRG